VRAAHELDAHQSRLCPHDLCHNLSGTRVGQGEEASERLAANQVSAATAAATHAWWQVRPHVQLLEGVTVASLVNPCVTLYCWPIAGVAHCWPAAAVGDAVSHVWSTAIKAPCHACFMTTTAEACDCGGCCCCCK
jgi:hypothetical protein